MFPHSCFHIRTCNNTENKGTHLRCKIRLNLRQNITPSYLLPFVLISKKKNEVIIDLLLVDTETGELGVAHTILGLPFRQNQGL